MTHTPEDEPLLAPSLPPLTRNLTQAELDALDDLIAIAKGNAMHGDQTAKLALDWMKTLRSDGGGVCLRPHQIDRLRFVLDCELREMGFDVTADISHEVLNKILEQESVE